jgi:magnesium-protoporphyrin O-methyltransferase
MPESSYVERRNQLTTYFGHTAATAWQALTSTDPVSRIRRTVRAGRDEMRQTLIDWLPADMRGQTLFDAGCGTGALSIEAARRGAEVIAIDVAKKLVNVARERAARETLQGAIDFRVGDMLGDAPTEVDHVVAMDSLIHYDEHDVHKIVGDFSLRARRSVLFTSAPWTPALALMHFIGRLIPHGQHRAPAIEPIHIERLIQKINEDLGLAGWAANRTQRIKSGFYISQAIALDRT